MIDLQTRRPMLPAMANHGGARPGAGRKKGSKNSKEPAPETVMVSARVSPKAHGVYAAWPRGDRGRLLSELLEAAEESEQ